MRWILIFLLASLVFNVLHGWLARVGLGKLPGDISFRAGGRMWYVPLTSSVILTVLGMLIGWLV